MWFFFVNLVGEEELLNFKHISAEKFFFIKIFYGQTVSPIKCQHNKVTYILSIKKMSELFCLQKKFQSLKLNKNFTRVNWLLFLHPIREKTMSNCYIDQGWGESQNVNCQFWEIIICPFLKLCFGFSFNTEVILILWPHCLPNWVGT